MCKLRWGLLAFVLVQTHHAFAQPVEQPAPSTDEPAAAHAATPAPSPNAVPAPVPASVPESVPEPAAEPAENVPESVPEPATEPAENEFGPHRPGAGLIDRMALLNFEDVDDVSLVDLMGGVEGMRFGLNLFGDGSATINSHGNNAFSLNSLSLLGGGKLGGNASFLAELAFENERVEVERLWMKYARHGWSIIAGRVHTDLGFWNAAYHHGAWSQPTIGRPIGISFEDQGGILPSHWVGVTGEYARKVGTMGLRLSLGVGNGRGAGVEDVQIENDTNRNKAVFASLAVVPADNFELGIAGVYDRIAADDTVRDTPYSIGETIGSGYAVYSADKLMALVEAHVVVHTLPAQRFVNADAFALVAYHLRANWTPYLRTEYGKAAATDPVFSPRGQTRSSFVESLAGLRFDLSEWSAVKLEYRYHRDLSLATNTHTVAINWAFGL